MKRLTLPLALSFALHGLILVGLWVWTVHGSDRPLAGSGGGSGVSIEIIGGAGERGERGAESAPPKGALPTTSKIAAKSVRPKKSKKSRKGSPRGDSVPVGVPGPAGPGQGPGAPGPGSGAAGGTNPVLAEIHARIERAKRYPLMARKMNMEGTSYVRFAIGTDGRPQDLGVKTSSGYPVLDNAALETIRRAAPFPTYGDTLVIGIRFHIDR